MSESKEIINLDKNIEVCDISNYLSLNFTEFCFDENFEESSELETFLEESSTSNKQTISNLEFTSALLSANNKAEFLDSLKALSSFKYKTELTGELSDDVFYNLLSILRIELTKLLFIRRDSNFVKNLLTILEKRLTEYFGRNRDVIGVSDNDSDIKIEFEVVRSK